MITFICLFFPAVLAVYINEKLSGKERNAKQWMYLYVTDVLLINFACFFIKSALMGSGEVPMFDLYTDLVPARAVNYLIMAISGAVALGVLQVLLGKTVKISVEECEDDR